MDQNTLDNSKTFIDILKSLDVGVDKTRKGQLFERIIKKYFLADAVYSGRFTNLWLWDDSPFRDDPKFGGMDYGIDLVAQENDGTYCAIQSKFYGRDKSLDWNGLLKFLNAVGEGTPFSNSILVYTGKKLTPNQLNEMEKKNCQYIDYPKLKKSRVDWGAISSGKTPKPPSKFKERPHQKTARMDVIKGLAKDDRGKLIMACGTGKTFVTLKIAEQMAGKGGTVLYLVPSISLIQQSMREWAEQKSITHKYIGVCSDTRTGRDDEDVSMSELEIPVTTDSEKIVAELEKNRKDSLTVVFSTYQSLFAVSSAQKKWEKWFDLVICDEAHRTTGVALQGAQMMKKTQNKKKGTLKQDLSYFLAIHDNKSIGATKRLYTTATPKIYPRFAKEKAKKMYHKDFDVFSMDDEATYGKTMYHLKFSEAIDQGLLSDYRVVVLTVTDKEGADTLQNITKGNKLDVEHTGKMVGCWRALRDPEKDTYTVGGKGQEDWQPREIPLQRAIVFTKSIAESKKFSEEFPKVVNAASKDEETTCGTWHVDGGHNALERRERLNWLEESGDDERQCRVLSNARCLTEGVDVPTLDAVIFTNSRTSTIDVIQAVGRVMRKADGKDYGYIIIPVVVKSNASVQKTLEDDDTYGDVWDVIRALRAHDDRIEQYLISGNIPNMLISRPPSASGDSGSREGPMTSVEPDEEPELNMDAFLHLIRTKLADKVGDRRYLESWANDVAKIVGNIKLRINALLKKNSTAKKEFDAFHTGLKKIINDHITVEEATDMLAQHMIMGRVFDSLFKDVDFVKDNPVSQVIDKVVKTLHSNGLGTELADLEGFYKDVEGRVSSITSHEGRHRVMIELYEKFFTHAFKDATERLGIVYTPVEIIDFILRSTDNILCENFGVNFSNRDVHVVDPFVGTGSFISRLLSKDLNLIKDADLEYKYKNRLHANEIVLLAYYIAAVNCESTFSERLSKFTSFNGIILTDTFHRKKINEQWDEGLFSDTEKQIARQCESEITVITSNPPWSVGDKKYKGTAKPEYKESDVRIKETYIKKVRDVNPDLTNIVSLRDSYIRSLRWASDRIGKSGVVAFVTNASFIRSDVAAGIRACFTEEFTDVWCFDLRGNQRTQGEISKREGGKIFGSGSRAPVSITILVKNPSKKGCVIHYKDIGDYHTREQKLEKIKDSKSIIGIKDWQIIQPDKHHDWLDQRNPEFEQHIPIGSKAVKSGNDVMAIFRTYSSGIKTHRDDWAYNSSKDELYKNMKQHIEYCNEQDLDHPKLDPKKAKWTGSLSDRLKRFGKQKIDERKIRQALYRPFFKQNLYFDKVLNEAHYRVLEFFPKKYSKNPVICVPYKFTGEFSAFVTDITPDLQVMFNGQCFPLYVYENKKDKNINITDYILQVYQTHYNDKTITKKDIFYYTYGMLHHPKYKKKFANNLSRELARIPVSPDFWSFSKAGEKLVDLHLNFDSCKRYNLGKPKTKFSKFTHMSFGTKQNKKDYGPKTISDMTKLGINGNEAYDNIPVIKYMVNGRTPLEWIIDRYKITTNKISDITNDPCTGTDITAVIERAVYVGVESDKIISQLPKEFESKDWKPQKTGLDAYYDDGNF